MSVDEFAQLRRYLLGQLPDGERDAVEDRYFTSAEALAQLEAVEAELMDAYVDGSLSPHERAQWDAYLAAHPNSRERVEFATALHHRFLRRPAVWKLLAPWVAIAAALLLAVFLSNRWEPVPPRTPAVFAITLTPGTLRSAAEAPHIVRIPPDVEWVRLTLSGTPAANVIVRLVDTGGSVWNAALVQSAVEIPAGVLKDGDYVATTLGSTGDELADYSFRVQRLVR